MLHGGSGMKQASVITRFLVRRMNYFYHSPPVWQIGYQYASHIPTVTKIKFTN